MARGRLRALPLVIVSGSSVDGEPVDAVLRALVFVRELKGGTIQLTFVSELIIE